MPKIKRKTVCDPEIVENITCYCCRKRMKLVSKELTVSKRQTITLPESSPICLDNDQRICESCESRFKRTKIKQKMSSIERQHNRDYKAFLKGKKFNEVKVLHTAKDGATENARPSDEITFFKS